MAEENKNQIVRLDKIIAEAKSVKEVFSLPVVRERFIANYEAVTGRKDGENRLEQERFAYLQLLAEKPELQQVDKFYHFGALVYAGTTGLSFRDNKLYVYPNGKGGLKVEPSPAGRREMLEMMPTIKAVPEAILVMKGDKFIHDKLNNIVVSHQTTDESVEDTSKLENIRAAYLRIYYKDGRIVDTVMYQSDLMAAKKKSKIKSESGLWHEFPGEAAKKSVTKRAYRLYHKYPDNVVLFNDGEDEDDVSVLVTHEEEPTMEEPPVNVDQDTGEVFEEAEEITPEEASPEKSKPKRKQINLLD